MPLLVVQALSDVVHMTDLVQKISDPLHHSVTSLNTCGWRRSVRDLKSETSKASKTRLYQIVHTTEIVFPMF